VLVGVEVYDPAHKLVPVLAVLGTKVLGELHDVPIQDFDAPVNIRLLWVGDAAETVVLLDDFREVPEFGWALHILDLLSVVGRLHILELFGGLLQLLVLAVTFVGQHALTDDRVLDVLVDGFVDVSKELHAHLEQLAVLLVAVVVPYPVATVALTLLLLQPLGFVVALLLLPRQRCLAEVLAEGGLAYARVLSRFLLGFELLLLLLGVLQPLLLLAVEDTSHVLDRLEGDQPRNTNLDGVGVHLQHELLGEWMGLLDDADGERHEVDLVAKQVVSKESLCDELFVDQHLEVLNEFGVGF